MVDFRLGEYIRIFFQISVAQVAQISGTLLNLSNSHLSITAAIFFIAADK